MNRVTQTVTIGLFTLVLLMPSAVADWQDGVEAYLRGDIETAVREWLAAAEIGDPEMQFNLGVMYQFGDGLPQNYFDAAKWYRKAAERGFPEAQYNLGLLYANGLGVNLNDIQAYAWLSLAEFQGIPEGAEMREIVAMRMTRRAWITAEKLARKYWDQYVVPLRDQTGK